MHLQGITRATIALDDRCWQSVPLSCPVKTLNLQEIKVSFLFVQMSSSGVFITNFGR